MSLIKLLSFQISVSGERPADKNNLKIVKGGDNGNCIERKKKLDLGTPENTPPNGFLYRNNNKYILSK